MHRSSDSNREIFKVFKSFFMEIINWIELHPVVSNGIFIILGAVIPIIFNFREK